jgi:threonine synthase
LLKNENSKIPKARDLLSEYKDALKQKDYEIEKLKKKNQDLYECIQGLPKIIKKIFIKNDDIKLLNS